MENIRSIVCNLSGCNESDVITKSRKRPISTARHILISYNHLILLMKQEDAVKEFSVNHSMVIHSIRTVQNLYKTDKKYRSDFGEFLENNKKILTHKFNHYDK